MNVSPQIRNLWRKLSDSGTPSTERVFKSLRRGRQWRIDETGIHEFRDDQPYVTVLWTDLTRYDGRKLSATNGASSVVALSKDRLAKFRQVLNAEWSHRSPERFRANQAWALRRSAWVAFLWAPLFFAVFCVPTYLLLPIAEHRNVVVARRLHAKLEVWVVLSVLSLLFLWISYGYRRWKFRQGSAGIFPLVR